MGRRHGPPEARIRPGLSLVHDQGYPRVKEIIEQDVASGLIYLTQRRGLQEPRGPALPRQVRPRLRRHDAVDRVKVMKVLWDAIGTEFGGRHELYERNYSGNHEDVKAEILFAAQKPRASAR